MPNLESKTAAVASVCAWLGLGRGAGGYFPGWTLWATVLLAAFALLPSAQLASALLRPPPELWQQIRPQLPGLFSNSLGLAAAVALGSGLLGTGLAWLTTLCDFPGRRFFSWALLLPIAMPAYVLGFVALGLFDAGGLGQRLWLAWQGGTADPIPIRSFGGLSASLSLSYYPYVYLAARQAFQTQSGPAMEAAHSLGAGLFSAFFRAGLPAAKPWIAAGLAVVIAETLADLGVVSIFRYETLSSALYANWQGLPTTPASAHLAGWLLLLAYATLAFKQRQRNLQNHYQSANPNRSANPRRLPHYLGMMACGTAALVFALAFAIPILQLLVWWAADTAHAFDGRFASALCHSLLLAGAGAGLILGAALAVSLAKRQYDCGGFVLLAYLANMGHALPGAALAAGLAIPAVSLDNALADLAKAWAGADALPMLSGGLGLLPLAYLVRFLALAFTSTDNAFRRVTPNLEAAAQSLGARGYTLWRQVHYPLLREGLLAAFLLAFVAILQELPMTLLLRPADWDTLATSLFALGMAGESQQAALPALALVLAGLLPIIALLRGMGYRHG
ncbi:MAG: ABC transporter permease [Candidatus Methylumidiphilus sp.]